MEYIGDSLSDPCVLRSRTRAHFGDDLRHTFSVLVVLHVNRGALKHKRLKYGTCDQPVIAGFGQRE